MMDDGNISDSDSLPGMGGGPAGTGSPPGAHPRVAPLTPDHPPQQPMQPQQPRAAAFDDNAEDVMAAAVANMEAAATANPNGRQRDLTGDQALMGANNEDGNVEGLEATDENGELVRQEFTKFLQQ